MRDTKMVDTHFEPVNTNLSYDQAKILFETYIKEPGIHKHCRASEVIMRGLARHFGQDDEQWAILGLLHDAYLAVFTFVVATDGAGVGLGYVETGRTQGYCGQIIINFQSILLDAKWNFESQCKNCDK